MGAGVIHSKRHAIDVRNQDALTFALVALHCAGREILSGTDVYPCAGGGFRGGSKAIVCASARLIKCKIVWRPAVRVEPGKLIVQGDHTADNKQGRRSDVS